MLGPLLWNVVYDAVLRTALPPTATSSAVDDTLVVVGGFFWGRAVANDNWLVACVVSAIKDLGLRMVPAKTEALFFHDGSRGASPQARIRVGDTHVSVGLKYLGLYLDGRWGFVEHFTTMVPKLGKKTDALYGLMPNLRGPALEGSIWVRSYRLHIMKLQYDATRR